MLVWFLFFKVVLENRFFKILRTIYENIDNTILVFSKNYVVFVLRISLYYVLCIFFRKKKLRTKCVICVFLIHFIFQNKKLFVKFVNEQSLINYLKKTCQNVIKNCYHTYPSFFFLKENNFIDSNRQYIDENTNTKLIKP